MMPLVSIITVNYNHHHLTEELLRSIKTKNNYHNIEIIVVDNGSKINPCAEWALLFPHIKLIRSEINLGFAGGNNLGIKAAKGDYLFLVNNDTEFTEGLIDQLLSTMLADEKIGMVSPKIRYFFEPDTLQYVGFTPMNYFTASNRCLGQFEKDNGQYDHLTGKTGYAHGAAMLVSKKAMDKAGLMAENFFLYYEEMDWCEQFKAAGYQIWVDMHALIYHKESMSVGKKSALKEFFMNRNRILFIRRNADYFSLFIFSLYFILLVTPRNIITYIRDHNYKYIAILFSAIWWNITHKADSTDLGYKL
jgi:GT2 family glycosyltransferase